MGNFLGGEAAEWDTSYVEERVQAEEPCLKFTFEEYWSALKNTYTNSMLVENEVKALQT
jgi:hypothetical protein